MRGLSVYFFYITIGLPVYLFYVTRRLLIYFFYITTGLLVYFYITTGLVFYFFYVITGRSGARLSAAVAAHKKRMKRLATCMVFDCGSRGD